jgi:hypothetical protein
MSQVDAPVLAGLRAKLKDYDYVSFAELSQQIEGFRGDLEMLDSEVSDNRVLWAGLSREAYDAIRVILAEGDFVLRPASLLVYACDGLMLTLPLAKGRRRYKRPHWVPVCFCRKGSR